MSLDLKHIRRELHRIPELAFQENQTKKLLLSHLKKLPGIRIREFSTNTGILVEYSHGAGPYMLFRADMDALPVTENSGCDFTSQHPGLMHACGHDIHMTVLLGLIERVVSQATERNLLFLFQPAEEGQGGAQSVLAEGLIQEYDVKAAFALHVASGLPVGTVSSRAGIFFGIPQEFDVTFIGKSAHAAFPEEGVNALSAARDFLALMDQDMAEHSADHRLIFHVGKLEAGTVRNVVPERCVLQGTQRSLEKALSDQINQLIKHNATQAAQKHGADFEFELLSSYDPVVNAPELVERLKDACAQAGISFQEAEIVLTGEDFGFFTSIYPGLLFWLGSGCSEPLHSSKFLPNEACIEVGVQVFEALIQAD